MDVDMADGVERWSSRIYSTSSEGRLSLVSLVSWSVGRSGSDASTTTFLYMPSFRIHDLVQHT
eukprot:6160857-Pyramimonas_sp.AAC.1